MIKTVSIVVINDEGKILALKRSPDKKWYPGKWDILSGKIEEGESPDECFKRELLEEAGITDYHDVETRPPYVYEEAGLKWLVYSFRCKTSQSDIKLDSEHSEFKWTTLEELINSEHATPLRTELHVFYEIQG
ncbi:NUDIX domain-containing protein [Candidatus Micrarchaeota archaeon]|nr:NUDIX domain-containing protein [Candidatus Micrarchaeota archaeon]